MKQDRSILTQHQLVAAARNVFARDGFERARLQDISSSAGKTRGAFYAHFKDKEDIFFAIFEQDIARDQEMLKRLSVGASTQEARIHALASHIVAVIEDRKRMLLCLEFKMYVLRHPQEQSRLSALHTATCERGVGSGLHVFLPESSPATSAARRRKQMAQLCAIVDGLALNTMFDPDSFNRKVLLAQTLAGIHALLK